MEHDPDAVVAELVKRGVHIKKIARVLQCTENEIEDRIISYGKRHEICKGDPCWFCSVPLDFGQKGRIPTQTPCCMKYVCISCVVSMTCEKSLKMTCPSCESMLDINRRLYDQWKKHC